MALIRTLFYVHSFLYRQEYLNAIDVKIVAKFGLVFVVVVVVFFAVVVVIVAVVIVAVVVVVFLLLLTSSSLPLLSLVLLPLMYLMKS